MIYVPVFCNSIWIPSDCSFHVIDGIFSISGSASCVFPIMQHSCSNTHTRAHTHICVIVIAKKITRFSDLRQDQNSVTKRTHLNTILLSQTQLLLDFISKFDTELV